MSFRSRASLSVILLCVGACAEVRTPETQPDDDEPIVDGPPAGGGSKPVACTIDSADVGDWQSAQGPRELSTHRLAATPGALFVASPHALRRSDDLGKSFQVVENPVSNRFPGPMAALDGTLFIGTTSGAVRSSDLGVTWLSADSGLDGGIAKFHRGRTALLARSTSGSLLRWSAVSAAWENVDSGSSYSPGVAASDGKTVLVDTGAGVLRSTDLSAWSLVSGLEAWGYEDLLIADELGLAITASGEIRRSADAGVSWLPAQQSTLEIGTASRVIQHGDAMFALTSKGVVRSGDGGAAWGISLADTSSFAEREVAESGDLLAVELGSISVTSDGGATWSDAASFADSTPIAFAKVGSWLFTSTDAAGVFVSGEGQGFQSTDASGYYLRDAETQGDTSYLVFSQRPELDAAYGLSWATRTSDGGESFEAVPLPASGDMFGRAFESIAVAGDVILAGGIDVMSGYSQGPGIWASSDNGASWSLASAGLPVLDAGAELYPAVLSLTKRGDSLFALLDDAGVFESTDAGETWARVGDELPAALDLDGLLVADEALYLWSHSTSGLYRSTGDGWELALPKDPPKGQLTALTAVGSTLVAAFQTELGEPGSGVYLSNDRGVSWQSVGLDARVRSLFVDGQTLRAGVEGQGTFSLDIGACD
jgi:hypothetical protein